MFPFDDHFQLKSCSKCQHMGTLKTSGPDLQPIITNQPWEALGIDLIGPFQTSESGNRYTCTMTDLFTKFVFAEPIPDKTAVSVAKAIQSMTYLYGPPQRIISDQGREFVNEVN
jgi:hypothetical protein